jgi:predicted secreted protein
MASASYNVTVQVASTAGGTYTTMGGVNDVSLSLGRTLVDVSEMNGSDDFTKRLAALKDTPITVSGFYDPADTAFGHLRSNFDDPASNQAHVKIFTDGTTRSVGFQVQVLVESLEISASADGAQELSVNLQSAGDLSFLP